MRNRTKEVSYLLVSPRKWHFSCKTKETWPVAREQRDEPGDREAMSESLQQQPQQQHGIYSQKPFAKCDRRLSRAARTLLKRQVLRAADEKETEDHDVWTLLDQWLGKSHHKECSLLPNRDALRHDEEQSLPVPISTSTRNFGWAYPSATLQKRRSRSPLRPQEWWQCGYCGKTFATRYYLDLHMTEHHGHHGIVEDAGLICPAVEWCKVVGLANCHEQALADETYYDRGSGGWGDDRKHIEHKWTKLSHSVPCILESVQSECREALNKCGVGSTLFCDSIACPKHKSWHLYSLNLLPDHWQDTWLEEAQHHPGWLGFLLVCFISVWVYYYTPWTLSKHDKRGKKLLGNNSTRTRSRRFLTQRKKHD